MNIDLLSLLELPVAGNLIGMWLLAVLVALLLTLGLVLLRSLLMRRLRPVAEARPTSWRALLSEVLDRTRVLFILIVGVYGGSRLLVLPAPAVRVLTAVFVIALFVQAAIWADRVVSTGMNWQLSRRGDGSVRNAMSLIQFVVRTAVWSIALLLILDNLAFDVTALVAGLGIGGVAVALAAQSILGDLFASLSIVLDKPFEVGDFIIFDDFLGTVERIGIKTTRIRSLSGEQLVLSNSDLLTSRIRNFKRMRERRVVFSLGATYQTPPDKVARVPAMLREIVEAQERVRFDRAHFQSFGDSALMFEVVYWVLSPDFNIYMDIQQAINLAIMRRFQDEGIEFAYPTRTVHLYASQDLSAATGAARVAGG